MAAICRCWSPRRIAPVISPAAEDTGVHQDGCRARTGTITIQLHQDYEHRCSLPVRITSRQDRLIVIACATTYPRYLAAAVTVKLNRETRPFYAVSETVSRVDGRTSLIMILPKRNQDFTDCGWRLMDQPMTCLNDSVVQYRHSCMIDIEYNRTPSSA